MAETETKQVNGKPKKRGPARAKPRTSRQQRPFPAGSFEDAAQLGQEIQRLAGGQRKIRRLTLFEQLGRSADSGTSRQQVINSGRYAITTGGIRAEFLELTDKGLIATNADAPPRDRVRAQFELAILDIAPLAALYEALKNNKLPAQQVMRDQLVSDQHLSAELAQEAVELFIVNAKYVGVLRPVAGTERVLTIEHTLDELPATPLDTSQNGGAASGTSAAAPAGTPGDYEQTCFYVTPIGEDGDPVRKHSDVFLGHLVEPAVEALGMGLHVVRADQIENPGLISAQVIQHLLRARLVVADISFHNPNVFYELAIRHATGKPTVLLCRTEDTLPFDISEVRTIRIDATGIHSFVTQMETWRAELTNMARRALEDPSASANPLTAFAGDFQALAAR
jgi:hypothetical protein